MKEKEEKHTGRGASLCEGTGAGRGNDGRWGTVLAQTGERRMEGSEQKNVRFISDKRPSYCCVEGGRGSRKITWKVWHNAGAETQSFSIRSGCHGGMLNKYLMSE